jgi:hypothetical protein
MKAAMLLLAWAGAASVSDAVVNTSIVFQVSVDGTSWSNSVLVPVGSGAPATTNVLFRALVCYTGTASPVGLASFVFQPTMSTALATDTMLPFVNGGAGSNTSTPIGVLDQPSQQTDTTSFGRLSPWGRSALSSTSALHGFFHTNPNNDGINYLRIAQAQTTAWLGGAGNTTGGGGVPLAQLSDVGRTSSDPAFNGSLTNIYVFKFGIQLTIALTVRDLVIDSPPIPGSDFPTLNPSREVYWYATMAEATGSVRGEFTVNTATIHTVPTPSATVIGVLGLAAIDRRRR